MLVDSGCYALARFFFDDVLGATDQDIRDLAEAFQMAAEDACSNVELRDLARHKD